jgi:hypothetical protein
VQKSEEKSDSIWEMKNRFRSGGIFSPEIIYKYQYPNRGVFSIKNEDSETGDILRETQISQKYRYAKKTQLSLDFIKYRYVGDTAGFSSAKTVMILKDTCNLNKFCQTTIYSFLQYHNKTK